MGLTRFHLPQEQWARKFPIPFRALHVITMRNLRGPLRDIDCILVKQQEGFVQYEV